jgi:hypothetical protein
MPRAWHLVASAASLVVLLAAAAAMESAEPAGPSCATVIEAPAGLRLPSWVLILPLAHSVMCLADAFMPCFHLAARGLCNVRVNCAEHREPSPGLYHHAAPLQRQMTELALLSDAASAACCGPRGQLCRGGRPTACSEGCVVATGRRAIQTPLSIFHSCSSVQNMLSGA